MTRFPAAPSFRLDGRSALVAGGTSGIGRGAAAALAEAGARVTIAARSPGGLAETRAEFGREGYEVRVLELDVTDREATAARVGATGPYDILVNSAGIARHAPAAEAPRGQ